MLLTVFLLQADALLHVLAHQRASFPRIAPCLAVEQRHSGARSCQSDSLLVSANSLNLSQPSSIGPERAFEGF